MHHLSIIKYPSGRFGYVGSVPAELAIECPDACKERAAEIVYQVGMGMAQKIAEREGWELKTRVFSTEQEAKDYATQKGYTIN